MSLLPLLVGARVVVRNGLVNGGNFLLSFSRRSGKRLFILEKGGGFPVSPYHRDFQDFRMKGSLVDITSRLLR